MSTHTRRERHSPIGRPPLRSRWRARDACRYNIKARARLAGNIISLRRYNIIPSGKSVIPAGFYVRSAGIGYIGREGCHISWLVTAWPQYNILHRLCKLLSHNRLQSLARPLHYCWLPSATKKAVYRNSPYVWSGRNKPVANQ